MGHGDRPQDRGLPRRPDRRRRGGRGEADVGEYGVYCEGKMVAIIGDEQLFIKPTAGGRALSRDAEEVPPYPGAKPYLLIDADSWDDRDWLTELVRITAAELPAPKPKPPKGPKTAR